jgi:hypothetical protein
VTPHRFVGAASSFVAREEAIELDVRVELGG